MSDLTLRNTKGAELTYDEGDDNFTLLNSDSVTITTDYTASANNDNDWLHCVPSGSNMTVTLNASALGKGYKIGIRNTSSNYDVLVLASGSSQQQFDGEAIVLTLKFAESVFLQSNPGQTHWTVLSRRSKKIPHTFTIRGTVGVTNGGTNYNPPMIITVATGQTVSLEKLSHVINSGTEVKFDLHVNNTAASSDYNDIVCDTNVSSTSTAVDLSDGDVLYPVIVSVCGNPGNMSITALLKYSDYR